MDLDDDGLAEQGPGRGAVKGQGKHGEQGQAGDGEGHPGGAEQGPARDAQHVHYGEAGQCADPQLAVPAAAWHLGGGGAGVRAGCHQRRVDAGQAGEQQRGGGQREISPGSESRPGERRERCGKRRAADPGGAAEQRALG